MPTTPLGPCLEPGCPHRGTNRGRCKDHATARDAELKAKSPRSRSVYGTKRWQALRRQVLIEAGHMCEVEDCTSLATEVDHRIRVEEGGDPYERRNLQALCKKHHSAKTAREVWGRK